MLALTRRPVALIATLAVISFALLAGGLARADGPVGYSQGHVDLVDVELHDGELELHIHDEDIDEEFHPEDVTFLVKDAAETAVPADPAYGFLGAPGAPVWILPQTQDTNLIWPGIATEEIAPGDLLNDEVNIELVSVGGPGNLAIYTQDSFGTPTVLLDSGDGLPDVLTIGLVHLHANWAFTAPGTYTIVFKASAQLADSTPIESEPATYTIIVGGELPVLSALDHKEAALEVLQPFAGEHTRIAQAIAKINDSLDPALWVGPNKLEYRAGNAVFAAERQAVNKLKRVKQHQVSPAAWAAIAEAIDLMVAADRILAECAIHTAIEEGGNATKIAKAEVQVANGDADAAAGKHSQAIRHYQNAWKLANQALP